MVSWRRHVERRFTEVSRLRVPLPGGGSTRERWAILAELHGPEPVAGERWAVWAAAPPSLGAAGGRVRGVRPYCSGARVCTRALVAAGEGTWPATGMAAGDSLDVRPGGVPAEAAAPAPRVRSLVAEV